MKLPVKVKSADYAYDGVLIAVVTKTTGAIRYVVEDANGRLFIHNAQQLGQQEGWRPPQEDEHGKRSWRALPPAVQAGIRCHEALFWAFLHEEMRYAPVSDETQAADTVRRHCGVDSRADLSKPGLPKERARWLDLDARYQAWKAKEGLNA